MNTWRPYLITGLLLYTLIVAFSYWEYKQNENILKSEINEAFQQAIKKDYEIRLERSKLISSFKTYSLPDSLIPSKGIKIGSAPQKVIPYSKEVQKDIPSKNMQAILEYGLENTYPLTPCGLDSIFRSELLKKGIKGETNISISNNKNDNKIFCHKGKVDNSYFGTQVQNYGIKATTKVQGWIKYNIWSVFRKMEILGISWLLIIVLSVIGYIAIKIKRKKKEIFKDTIILPQENTFDFKWKKVEDNCFELGNITFDYIKKILYDKVSGEIVSLSEQLAQLLLMFLEEPNHCANRKQIGSSFWPEVKDQATLSKKTSKLINKLKEKLAIVTKVDFEKSKGTYILRCRTITSKVIRKLNDDEYQIGDYLLNIQKKTLRINNVNHSVTAKVTLTLEMLLKTPDDFIKSEDLIEAVIKKKEEEVNRENLNSQLEATIIKAQEALGKDKDLEIIGSIESGYKLVLNNPTNKK
ncbi:hypothetical protein [Parabacteroides pacaensis]|uniref:hypothetical protein n=1 Tax=Parabacteroides pacaensis TaxID=2086575 RepID=UPI000D103BD7|nr:hypothetical protein [Parabacteroides pacaensis]